MANRMSIAGPSVSAGSGSDVPPLHTVTAATGSSAKGVQPGRDTAQRHHGKSVTVVGDAGLDGMTAHPLVALSVGGMPRRRRARRMAGGASSAFFSPREAAVDAAAMDRDAEAVAHELDQIGGGQLRLFALRRL